MNPSEKELAQDFRNHFSRHGEVRDNKVYGSHLDYFEESILP